MARFCVQRCKASAGVDLCIYDVVYWVCTNEGETGVWYWEELAGKEAKKSPHLFKKGGFTALKPMAVYLPLRYPISLFSFFLFAPVLISLHPPVKSPHSQTFHCALSGLSTPAERTRDESIKLHNLPAKQKSWKKGLCYCACINREEVLLRKPHSARL